MKQKTVLSHESATYLKSKNIDHLVFNMKLLEKTRKAGKSFKIHFPKSDVWSLK